MDPERINRSVLASRPLTQTAPGGSRIYYGWTDISVRRNISFMAVWALFIVALATALALVSLGGGAYEFLVVDPAWPRRPELIQPQRGGISRSRFWIPAHSAFELCLLAAFIVAWSAPGVRPLLWVAAASHVAMRVWSFVDFIPKALAFERADPAAVEAPAAERWVRRSLIRLPLDLVTCGAMLMALASAARLG
jgi:hypothetical protein